MVKSTKKQPKKHLQDSCNILLPISLQPLSLTLKLSVPIQLDEVSRCLYCSHKFAIFPSQFNAHSFGTCRQFSQQQNMQQIDQGNIAALKERLHENLQQILLQT